ncbi:MAG: hypothetical protein AB7O24_08135 [Kofleriaceae bacterium]
MITRLATRALCVAALAVACQSSGDQPAAPIQGSGAAPAPAGSAVVASDGAVTDDARVPLDEPEPVSFDKRIAELGAIPAWQAVIDRAQLLARRKQRGVVYGTVGPSIMISGPPPSLSDAGVPIDAGLVASEYVWLVDDTEGNGSLGIAVKLGERAAAGARVAIGGAWDVDAERRWHWKVLAVEPLPPAPPSELKVPALPAPSHAITTGPIPAGAKPVSQAKDNDVVYFQIVGPPPLSEGDGWQIADRSGATPFAVINLPGERGSYGGQDLRTPDERWQLKRNQTYWVQIGKLRQRAPDKPIYVNARTAPVKAM